MLPVHVAAYAAGILDGEGSVCLGRRYGLRDQHAWQLRITVGNTSKALTDWLLVTLGGNARLGLPGTGGHKPVWYWELWAIEASRLLRAVLPYLVIKRRHAEVALEYREAVRNNDTGAMQALEQEITALNRKGPPV